MKKNINGHVFEQSRNSSPYGSSIKYWCKNDGCHLDTGHMEFNASDKMEDLAEEYPCPSGTAQCIRCGHDIEPDAEICKQCSLDIKTGDKVFSR